MIYVVFVYFVLFCCVECAAFSLCVEDVHIGFYVCVVMIIIY